MMSVKFFLFKKMSFSSALSLLNLSYNKRLDMVNWSYKSSSYMILRKNESLKATTKQCVILKG